MFQDPFLLVRSTEPAKDQVDIVSALEAELRVKKKDEVKDKQSQELNASSSILPDLPGQENTYLKNRVAKYAVEDNWKPGQNRNSVLGDFSAVLDMTSVAPVQNSGMARNQLMSMTFSTLAQEPPAERIIESQLAYNLAASQMGLESKSKKAFKAAKKYNKLQDNMMY